MTQASLSIGVAGALGPHLIAQLARHVESAGFSALWVNDTADGDSLAALAAAARTTTSLTLATGVIPADRRSAADVARIVADLPQERIVIGVGSGGAKSGVLGLVGHAVTVLKAETSATVLVGALGPRMRQLAARQADGPLLGWLTPSEAASQAAEAKVEAADAQVSLYVRTALEPAATERLRAEADRYATYPHYAANFARLGIDVHDTVLDTDSFERGIRDYQAAVDEVVLRAIVPSDNLADYVRFVEVAAAALNYRRS